MPHQVRLQAANKPTRPLAAKLSTSQQQRLDQILEGILDLRSKGRSGARCKRLRERKQVNTNIACCAMSGKASKREHTFSAGAAVQRLERPEPKRNPPTKQLADAVRGGKERTDIQQVTRAAPTALDWASSACKTSVRNAEKFEYRGRQRNGSCRAVCRHVSRDLTKQC